MHILGAVITVASALLLQAQGLPTGSQTVFKTTPESASLSDRLQDQLTIDGLLRHSQRLQQIAADNGNTRVFGSGGHNETIKYISQSTLENGYLTWLEPLYLNYTERVKESAHLIIPIPDDIPIRLMTFTESTPVEGVTAPLALVSNQGCSSSDYNYKIRNSIALVKRGECSFGEKAYEAGKAGAKALLIYNNEDGPLSGTLGQDFPPGAPTAGITKEAGEQLISFVENGDIVTLTVTIIEKREERLTYNVIAETKGGDKSKVIVIGAHSDSVSDGPGINDDGSGTSALLELSYLFRNVVPKYAVRFCWWTGEEFGLLGSKHTQMLADEKEREKIALYLNFDMIASPNAYNGIYEGSSDTAPEGSAAIEQLFKDFFDSQGVPHDPAEYDGRSDYYQFIVNNIPAGGTFTGAEVKMTEEQAARYKNGKAGVAYDECYHQACDNVDNLNHDAFLLHAKAMAHAIATFSESLELIENEQSNAKQPKAMFIPELDWPEGTLKGTKAM